MEELMDIVITIFGVLSAFLFLIFIGFTITFFIGVFGKYKNVKKIGLIGLGIAGISSALFFGISVGTQAIYNHQQEQIAEENEKEFAHYSKQFKESYLTIAQKSEDVTGYICDQWHDKMFDSDNDESADTIVENAMDDKADDIEDIKNELATIEDSYVKIAMYAPNKRTAKQYQSAYSELKEFASLATNPHGKYDSYTDKYSDLDDKVAKDYKEL